jgi:hypothetical protein
VDFLQFRAGLAGKPAVDGVEIRISITLVNRFSDFLALLLQRSFSFLFLGGPAGFPGHESRGCRRIRLASILLM